MQPGYSASYTGGQERLPLREHRPPEVRLRPRGTPEASEVGTNLSDAPLSATSALKFATERTLCRVHKYWVALGPQ